VLYEISEEQRIMLDTVRSFGEEKIKPVEEENDREGRYPEDLVAEMAKLGLMGSAIPEEYGGTFRDFFTLAILSEEIAKYSPSLGTVMGRRRCCSATTWPETARKPRRRNTSPWWPPGSGWAAWV